MIFSRLCCITHLNALACYSSTIYSKIRNGNNICRKNVIIENDGQTKFLNIEIITWMLFYLEKKIK